MGCCKRGNKDKHSNVDKKKKGENIYMFHFVDLCEAGSLQLKVVYLKYIMQQLLNTKNKHLKMACNET